MSFIELISTSKRSQTENQKYNCRRSYNGNINVEASHNWTDSIYQDNFKELFKMLKEGLVEGLSFVIIDGMLAGIELDIYPKIIYHYSFTIYYCSCFDQI